MPKQLLSTVDLKALCLTALREANLDVLKVDLVAVRGLGEQPNWELLAISPEPDLGVAERALSIVKEVQAGFNLRDAYPEESLLLRIQQNA